MQDFRSGSSLILIITSLYRAGKIAAVRNGVGYLCVTGGVTGGATGNATGVRGLLNLDYTNRPNALRGAGPALPIKSVAKGAQTGPKPAVAGRTAHHAIAPKLDGDGPIWQQIRRALADPILNGQWPPGTRIPTETALTGKFGTSRMTVSKAIQTLVADGLVLRRRKVGTLVAERAQERPVFEIWDIADLVARSGGRYAYKLLECRKLGPDPERRELLGVSLRTPVLWLRCMHLSDGRPIQLEERLININAAPNITCQPLETQGPGAWLLAKVPWTDAEHKIFAREAPAEVAAELQVKMGTACLVVDRRTWNQGTPVTLARLWHPDGRHNLVGHFKPAR
jgi:GntR family histidine utilization transcriptional repressor